MSEHPVFKLHLRATSRLALFLRDPMMTEPPLDVAWLQVTTTVETEDQAQALAAELVGQRVVACAQVSGPLTSHYTWQGKTERSPEWRLTLKTHTACWARLNQCLDRLHPYDCPQAVAMPLVFVRPDYEAWMRAQLDLPGA